MTLELLDEIDAVTDAEDASPEEAPASVGFTPFGYQQRAFDAAIGELDLKQRISTLVTAATGTGKTVIAGMFAKEFTERRAKWVLFLAHRDELLEGAQKDLAFVGVPSAIEKAEQYARKTILEAASDLLHPREIRVVVASVQSLQGKRLESWPRDQFDLILTDEAHHSVRGKTKGRGKAKRHITLPNEQYATIYRHFFGAKRIGLTATPRRKDKAEMGYWYESVAFEYPITAAIAEGNLVDVVEVRCDVTIDLKQVNMGAEDLNQGDLEDAISPFIEKMVRAIKEKIGDRKAIIFCPGRKTRSQKIRPCEAFAEGLRKVGITATSVWGDHPDRQAINRGFRAGEWQVVCNADLYSEGVNFPFVSAVVLASPTASPVVMGQRIGRGTRLYPGKTDCLVVTFDWQFDDHKFDLINPYHLMIPDGAEDVAAIARRLMAEGETDLAKVAEQAQEIAAEERARLEAEKARLEAEREAAKAKAEEIRRARQEAEDARRERLRQDALRLRVREGASGLGFTHRNPFAQALAVATAIQAAPSARRVGDNPTGGQPATPKQVQQLMEDYGLKHEQAAGLTVDEAAAMKSWLFARYRDNKATWGQYQELMRLGIDQATAMKVGKGQAGAMIDGLRKSHARKSG